MQTSSPDNQVINPYYLYVLDDPKLCKNSSEETTNDLWGYDLNALSICFLNLTRPLSDSAVNEQHNYLLKHKNQLNSCLSTYTTIEAIQRFSSASSYHKRSSDRFEKRPIGCQNEMAFNLKYRDPLKDLRDEVNLTPADGFVTKYGSAALNCHLMNATLGL